MSLSNEGLNFRNLLSSENYRYLINSICSESLHEYLKLVWPIIEPGRQFYSGWHIEAMCEHLEAVSRGDIRRLLINVPPRSTKSTLMSVVWPSWEWGIRPITRWLMTTYSDTLLQRDAIKCRDIVTSIWYRSIWGGDTKLKDDQSAVKFYKNVSGGYRVSTTPGGAGTGHGGDRICCDDAHNVKEREHPNQIKERVDWWATSMSTRFEDAETAAWVVSGQRVCLGDISDHCIEAGYEHLMIPMEYDQNNAMYQKSPRCAVTSLGWSDPRREGGSRDGEINICPARFPEHVLKEMKANLRINAEAQLNQDPKPGAGGFFDISKLMANIIQASPARGRRVRYWDKAFTEDGGKYTVGVLLNYTGNEVFIEDVVRKRLGPSKRNAFIKLIAMRDAKLTNNTVTIYIEEEPAAGKESSMILARTLQGFPVFFDKAQKNKMARAVPFASQVQAGNVFLVEADWNSEFLDELEYFPNATFKDQVDAVSGGYNKVVAGDMNSIEGELLCGGEEGVDGPLTKDDLRAIADISPELASIVAHSTGNIKFEEEPVVQKVEQSNTLHPLFSTSVPESQEEMSALIEDLSLADTPTVNEVLQSLELEVQELLGGDDTIQPGEFTSLVDSIAVPKTNDEEW